jgi:hypothetical protein
LNLEGLVDPKDWEKGSEKEAIEPKSNSSLPNNGTDLSPKDLETNTPT